MPKLGEIVHFTKSIKDGNETQIAVADTSYMIAVSQTPRECWLPDPSNIISNRNVRTYNLVIPRLVLDELDWNYEKERKDSSTGITKLEFPSNAIIEEISAKQIKAEFYHIPADLVLDIHNTHIKILKDKEKKLSNTDVFIIALIYQYAEQGVCSIGLTADRGIYDVLTDFKENRGLPIICASPFNLERHWLYDIDDSLLITDLLLAKIMKLKTEQSYRYYFGVLNKQEWVRFKNERDGFKNDIAAYLWQDAAISMHKKRKEEEVTYYPLILLNTDEYNKADIAKKAFSRIRHDGIQNCGYMMFAVPKNPPTLLYYKVNTSGYINAGNIKQRLEELNLLRIDANFLRQENFRLEQRVRQ